MLKIPLTLPLTPRKPEEGRPALGTETASILTKAQEELLLIVARLLEGISTGNSDAAPLVRAALPALVSGIKDQIRRMNDREIYEMATVIGAGALKIAALASENGENGFGQAETVGQAEHRGAA